MAKKYLAFSPYSDCTPSSWDMPWVAVHTSAEKHSQTVRCVPLVKCRGASALVKYREELPLGSKCLAELGLHCRTKPCLQCFIPRGNRSDLCEGPAEIQSCLRDWVAWLAGAGHTRMVIQCPAL